MFGLVIVPLEVSEIPGRLVISPPAALQIILTTNRPLRFLHRECASFDLGPNYAGYPQPLQRQMA